MAHALELPGQCTILKTHPVLNFKDGKYAYKIERKGEQSIYSVTDGEQTITASIGWAVGLGSAGQTYVYQKDGRMYQSRVSYYNAIDGLDFTLGALNAKPANLLEAAGQAMERDERVLCFGCHSTNAIHDRDVKLDALIPGVQCERCHGPTEKHLSSLAPMKDLRALTSEETSNFCGQCHRTFDQIATSGIQGIVDVRFQPYRLTGSKCYDADDARIRCTACHDPHQEVDKRSVDYDAKCQACHAGGKPAAKHCKVSTSNCASCHMPKIEIPGSHHLFTDHQIRIARANEPYPN